MPLYFSGPERTLYGVTGQYAGRLSRRRFEYGVRDPRPTRVDERADGGALDYEGWRLFLADADVPDGYVSRSCRVARTGETANLAIDAPSLPDKRSSPLGALYAPPPQSQKRQAPRGRSRSSPGTSVGPSALALSRGAARSGP